MTTFIIVFAIILSMISHFLFWINNQKLAKEVDESLAYMRAIEETVSDVLIELEKKYLNEDNT